MDTEDDELRIYIVVRKDLAMSKEKFGAQCGHAALSVWVRCLDQDPDRAREYFQQHQPKIVLEAKDDVELLKIQKKATESGFINETITDLGRTEFAEPTLTVLGIGPVWYQKEAQAGFIKRIRLYKSE
jgi:peptidyl-tRNA hydrolase